MSGAPSTGGVGRRPGRNYANASQAARLHKAAKASASRARNRIAGDEFDARFGYSRFEEGPPRVGWLLDMSPTTVPDEEGKERSGLDLYFLQQDGETFKVTSFYEPYFYLGLRDERYTAEVTQLLQRKFDSVGMTIVPCDKEDLDMPNHLSGKLHRFLRLSFLSVQDLVSVKSVLLPLVEKNKQRAEVQLATGGGLGPSGGMMEGARPPDDFFETLVDMREYDVPYVVRVAIDQDLRVGAWYTVSARGDGVTLKWEKDMLEKAEPRTLAFDIECTKAPLKFPDAAVDQVFMISYMVDGKGFLIISREVVSEDIADFEYTPKPAYPGPFTVYNCPDEAALLRRFVQHVQELRPQIFVTYNGDYFDWPFLEARMAAHGMDMSAEIGVSEAQGEYRARAAVHLDAFHWVKRDSYLPQGAQGLKSVTKYKLGYDPVEVDPEDMVRFASERPTEMASYSVSDAVATYYLYTTYVHNFIFSLCTIIPMKAEEVLRKGSGTLCETLLMVEAFKGNIVCPNKQVDPALQFYKGHLLESETYVGGHVECLETGVYRSDLAYKFRMVPAALQQLIDHVDRDLRFAIEVEGKAKVEEVANYAEVKAEIVERLAELRDAPLREEAPLIYHLDVGAMYPNIILTNRLQPCSIVDQSDCAACDFNQEKNGCKRPMKWVWRGDHLPATRADFEQVQTQLAYERSGGGAGGGQAYHALEQEEQVRKLRERLKLYSHTVYKKSKVTAQEEREDVVCMRENPFYVNTVRAFRDRRYEYKVLTKRWKGERAKAEAAGDALARKAAEDKETVFDSLQLAHKCILNSFYGYVMRKGARWRSMQMAGIVTDTGARLITQARELMEQIGRPLELDTDGIWCILPKSFPENFALRTVGGRKIGISYPCVMLNADVHERYTNHQYQTLADPATHRYETHSECSIFFEVDGPYRCMVLPSSTEEGRLLKKRYAVFNMDGSLAELKGFELKRRGELELIKAFQSQVFECFLKGASLAECYAAVAEVADYWLDVLDSKGEELDDDEVMSLISENKTISKTLEEYGDQKGTSLTTAGRLADFLGAEMVKDKGLNCRLVIANRPHGAPVTDRAIPTAIFSTEPGVRKHFLRKWLKDPGMTDFDIRSVIDWGYYKERLGKTIQKIITIPAAMQRVPNPVPRVSHPDWLEKKMRELTDGYRQLKISSLFAAAAPSSAAAGTPGKPALMDIEDTAAGARGSSSSAATPRTAVVRRLVRDGSSPAKAGAEGEQQQQQKQQQETATKLPPRPRCPPLQKDFQGWLAFRKAQWRAARQERRRQQGGRVGSRRGRVDPTRLESEAGTLSKRQNVASFLKSASLAVTQGLWQVIEVRESEVPGEFVVWAMTGPKALQRLALTVDRSFYVTSTLDHEHGHFVRLGGRKVSRFLPHGHRSPFTYEMVVPERRFLRNENGAANLLSTHGVTGVYELQTPLWFRAIAQMGCLTRVQGQQGGGGAGGKKGASSGFRFNLAELESVSSYPSYPYLHPSTALFHSLYLYVAHSGRRAVVALFVVGGDNRDLEPGAGDEGSAPALPPATAQVWLANPFSTAEARPPLKRFFARYAPAGARCAFQSAYVASLQSALAQLNAALAAYLQERHGPTVVLAQSGLDLSILRRAVPTLHDLPVVAMPGNADDNRFPALGWQAYAAQRMVQRFLCMPAWLGERLQAARYAHLPLGNLGQDPQRTMADVLLGRLLKGNRHVLWASEGPRPDLGGAEDDENDAWADEAASPVIRVPGAYRKICIELEIDGLAVLSMLNAADIDEMEGAQGLAASDVAGGVMQDGLMGGMGGGGGGGGVDDRACAGAFRLLRALVETWLAEVERLGSQQADLLATNFWRWMCDADSLFYDPALRRLCLMLMAKYFHRLVAEMRRLGAQVVFANAQRVVIATNKADMASAHEYASFVVRTVLSRRVFSRLQITPVRYWWQLLFLDEHNYGGLEFKDPQEAAARRAALRAAAEAEAAEAAARRKAAASAGEETEEESGSEAEGAKKKKKKRVQVAVESEEESDAEEGEEDELDDGAGRRRRQDEEELGMSGPSPGQQRHRRRVVQEEDEDEEDEDEEDEKQKEEEDAAAAEAAKKASRLEELDAEARAETAVEQERQRMEEDAADEEDYDLRSHWDLLNYLPGALRHPFDFIIATFLADHLREERQRKQDRLDRLAALGHGILGDDSAEAAASVAAAGGSAEENERAVQAIQREEEGHEAGMVKFVQKLVGGRLTRTLLRMVADIDNELRGPECFPTMVGSYRQLSKPALEFVKAVCRVLRLDPAADESVTVLRRQLLAQLGTKEFSTEGEAVSDYARSFILPDLICAFCSHCRDLDLCRDEQLLSEDPEHWWRCPHCQNRYDVDRIEQLLVESVQRTLTRYALQDVRCRKCRRVNTLVMAETCRCAGRLSGDEAPEEFATLLGTLRRVALHFGLEYLRETVDFALRIDPEEEAERERWVEGEGVGVMDGVAAMQLDHHHQPPHHMLAPN